MSQPNMNDDLNIISNSGLTITYMDGNLDIIQQLDDEPNDVGGLTAAELKAKFDEAGNTIKSFLNESLIPEILAADATEAARAAAETARANAEAERQTAEEQRASAETVRQSNEETRESNEAARVAAENARVNAESAREQAESGRFTAEQARASAETERDAAEQAREAAETARADENTGIVARATEQANIASSAAASASNSEEAAANSESAAAESKNAAAGSAYEASVSETRARASETAARNSEMAAKASETAAKKSETAAADSAKAAAASAEKAESGVFIATYGTTTVAEIYAAYQAGKSVLAKYNKFGLNFLAPLCSCVATDSQFFYVDALNGYRITVLIASESGWAYKTDIAKPNLHASAHASGGSDPITPARIGAMVSAESISGYDATKTQTLKHINGVLTWVSD